MTTVKEIENAVSKLPKEDLAQFRKWFDEYQSKVWDQELEKDTEAGKLNKVAEEVEKDFNAGNCKEL